MGIEEVEERLKENIGKIVSVNCHLGSHMSGFQSMMYAGKMVGRGIHYFVGSLEKLAGRAEVFKGVCVLSNRGYVEFNEGGSFTLYDGFKDWPKNTLLLDADEFRKVKGLWDACVKVGAVGVEEAE